MQTQAGPPHGEAPCPPLHRWPCSWRAGPGREGCCVQKLVIGVPGRQLVIGVFSGAPPSWESQLYSRD